MLTGNRGEWSEVYAFLRILSDGEIKPADANLDELCDEPSIPVIKIVREEKHSPRINYYVGSIVHADLDDGTRVLEVANDKVAEEADILYREIIAAGHARGAFAIPSTERFMDKLKLHALKAPSVDNPTSCSKFTMRILDLTPFAVGVSNLSSATLPPCSMRGCRPISRSGSIAAPVK